MTTIKNVTEGGPMNTTVQALNEAATAALHAQPCPGCGLEPEVEKYLRDTATKVRRGYVCSCGATVVDGLLVGASG